MPHHKSCKKRLITSEKSRIKNKGMMSRISTATKKVVSAKTKEEAAGALSVAFSAIDKALKKKIIHKNKAANRKSKLSAVVESK